MMGHRDIDSNYVPPTDEQLDYLGRNSFPAWLALNAHRAFPDSFFASLYDHTNGRPLVAPSQLMTLLLLQTHFGVSQREAMQAAKFDLRYRIPLGLTGQDVLCARSTYVLFRTKLLVSGASDRSKGKWYCRFFIENQGNGWTKNTDQLKLNKPAGSPPNTPDKFEAAPQEWAVVGKHVNLGNEFANDQPKLD